MSNPIRRCAPLAALFLPGLIGCGRPEPGPVLPEDLPWTPFRWVTAIYPEFRLERAAMLVTMRVGGAPSLLQLDLGASGSMPLGYPRTSQEVTIRRKGQLHGLAIYAPLLESPPSPGDSAPLLPGTQEIGTLGMPMFDRRLAARMQDGRWSGFSGTVRRARRSRDGRSGPRAWPAISSSRIATVCWWTSSASGWV